MTTHLSIENDILQRFEDEGLSLQDGLSIIANVLLVTISASVLDPETNRAKLITEMQRLCLAIKAVSETSTGLMDVTLRAHANLLSRSQS